MGDQVGYGSEGCGQCGEIGPMEDQISRLTRENEQLKAALTQSVKLQSHYAGILNDYDGGKRMQFADADAWIKRLAEQKDEPASNDDPNYKENPDAQFG